MSRFLHRWWWALLAVLVVAGLCRLSFNVDVLDLLPPDLPAVHGLKLYQQHFANARELIITLRAPDGERAERLAGELAARLRQETNLVTSVSWQPPWMEQPAQTAEIVAYLWYNQPPDTFGALTNRLSGESLQATLADAKRTLATSLSPLDLARRAFDPYDLLNVPALTNFSGISAEQGQQMFASADGTFRLLFVQARPDLAGYQDCSRWLSSIQTIINNVRAGQKDWEGTVVHYTGRPAFVTEIAGSMQHDLSGSITGTALIIAVLFWLAHRRWLPMLWLLALLALILVATMALGSLILGTISVVSLGFAAVLLGLAVDYAVVHYQEALSHPQLSVPEIRRAIAPSILWAAITTISAFLVLNLGGLPGLAQLGSLVAIGVALAALVMVAAFLPPLFPGRRQPATPLPPCSWWSFFVPPAPTPVASRFGIGTLQGAGPHPDRAALWTTGLLLLAVISVLFWHLPKLDKSADALRPQHAEAEIALNEITALAGIPQDPLWVIVTGAREAEVGQRLDRAEALLSQARSNGVIADYLLPAALWPRAENQAANRPTAQWLARQGPALETAALETGFKTNALFLTESLIQTWARAGNSTDIVWPTNDVSRWLLKRFVARAGDEWLALGLVYPPTNGVAASNDTGTTAAKAGSNVARPDHWSLAALSREMQRDQIWLSGWGLLGTTTLRRVSDRFWQLVLPMVLLVLTSLWLAFRRLPELLLSLAVLLLSGLCLLATMSLAGWSWNLLNLMGVPLILGTGVDYGIFIQLALRRYGGDTRFVRRSIGRALLLCGGTAIAGFGSLAWSSNAGMASLGKVCAAGIAANVLISVFLLPGWWARMTGNASTGSAGIPAGSTDNADMAGKDVSTPGDSAVNAQGPTPQPNQAPTTPSSFYRAWLWRFGLVVVRVLPLFALRWICVAVAEIYYRVRGDRREVVTRNLLPVLGGNQAAADRTTHALFRQMGRKMADLWQYESGALKHNWLNIQEDWDLFEAVRARGQGVLLITPHLGNWELGGALLARHGHKLLALTQAEPDSRLTELRAESRARWGIETLVVGADGFAFVEIIKRLQAGEIVALLIDRPPAPSAVPVELFGRPFLASVAAAELARASGCALLGVTVVRSGGGYRAKVLPEITYDRRALGNREARRELTQKIMRAFEPEIREHLDQWYHFVPIWP